MIPKIGILSAPRNGGTIKSQYLTPHSLHPSHAVTGAICIATASKASGTVAAELAQVTQATSEEILIEHQVGSLPIHIEVSCEGDDFTVCESRYASDGSESHGWPRLLLSHSLLSRKESRDLRLPQVTGHPDAGRSRGPDDNGALHAPVAGGARSRW